MFSGFHIISSCRALQIIFFFLVNLFKSVFILYHFYLCCYNQVETQILSECSVAISVIKRMNAVRFTHQSSFTWKLDRLSCLSSLLKDWNFTPLTVRHNLIFHLVLFRACSKYFFFFFGASIVFHSNTSFFCMCWGFFKQQYILVAFLCCSLLCCFFCFLSSGTLWIILGRFFYLFFCFTR